LEASGEGRRAPDARGATCSQEFAARLRLYDATPFARPVSPRKPKRTPIGVSVQAPVPGRRANQRRQCVACVRAVVFESNSRTGGVSAVTAESRSHHVRRDNRG